TDACPPPPRRPSTSYFPAVTVGVGVGSASARRRGTGDADLPEELEEVVQLRIDERLAAREQRCRDRALGIRPADDVGEGDVPERLPRVRAVRAEPVGSEHEAHPVAEWQAEGEVQLEVRVLERRAPHRALLADAHPAEGPAGAPQRGAAA